MLPNKTRQPELCWGQRARRRPCADDCVGKCVNGRRVVVRRVEDCGGSRTLDRGATPALCASCHVGKAVSRVLRRGRWWWG